MVNAPTPRAMHPLLSFVLTRKFPCAMLVILMLMSAIWLPAMASAMPPFVAMLFTLIGLSLHMLTPTVLALVTFGGGVTFAAQVAALSAAGVAVASGFSLVAGLIVLLLYGMMPIAGAVLMMGSDGVRRSAQYLAFGLGGLILLGLLIIAAMQDAGGVRALIDSFLMPLFDVVKQQLPAGDPMATQMLDESRKLMVEVLPGVIALGFWFSWWGDVVLARNVAVKLGFYRGDAASLLGLGFGKPVAYLFLALLLITNLGGGEWHYLGVNAAILVGGLLAAQGIAVGHSWLKARGMLLSIALMYLMLIIWSMLIIPFLIIGLMDIWFDYRRDMPAVGG